VLSIRNVHRTVGAMLAGEVARRHGKAGLPAGTIDLEFQGTAGQSFGAFVMDGMELSLEGDANDYVGKGMAGGIIAVRPHEKATFRADENILIGNVALYGATGGKAFFAGRAGERFCVRNSGAVAIVEGVGDHCCEYMTGGSTILLGKTGRNFAAGMSGGFAYVLDEQGDFETRVNPGMVELEALSAEDAAFVAGLIEEHRDRTRSQRAAALLSDWENTVARMVKVVPLEYRRVLAEMRESKNDLCAGSSLPVCTRGQVSRGQSHRIPRVRAARSRKAGDRGARQDWRVRASGLQETIAKEGARCMDCGIRSLRAARSEI
jgi:glutamate synthase domain-containing protein 3